MRKLLLCIAAVSSALTLQARDLTLDSVISMAQDSTVAAYRSRSALEQSGWEYRQFLSARKPQLSLVLDPSYQKYSIEPFTHYYRLRDYNMLNTYGELRLEQQANAIGGNYFVSTGAMWTEYFGNQNPVRLFSAVPIAAGYSNSLIGYNPYKWEKLQEDFNAVNREKLHKYELAKIASQAAQYYLDCVIAKSKYQICLENQEVASKMLQIGKEKFQIASISKNELFALELNLINAGNNLVSARNDFDNAREALCSYLSLDPRQDLDFAIPQDPELRVIDVQQAMDLALDNNPEIRQAGMKVLQARAQQDKARVQGSLLQTSVDLSIGLQNYNTALYMLYGERTPFVTGGVTLRIPIIDSGLARNRAKAASAALKTAQISQQDCQREIELQVTAALRDFNTAQDLLSTTSQAISCADESFALAEELYGNGEIDINTFILAQNRKDEAYTNWQGALSKYWKSYYALCSLCVWEF